MEAPTSHFGSNLAEGNALPDWSLPDLVAPAQECSHPHMVEEQQRRRTFDTFPWPFSPSTHPLVQPDRLAKAGFFRVDGESDRTVCAFCGITLSCWEPDDDPFIEHRKHKLSCPFESAREKMGDLASLEIQDQDKRMRGRFVGQLMVGLLPVHMYADPEEESWNLEDSVGK